MEYDTPRRLCKFYPAGMKMEFAHGERQGKSRFLCFAASFPGRPFFGHPIKLF